MHANTLLTFGKNVTEEVIYKKSVSNAIYIATNLTGKMPTCNAKMQTKYKLETNNQLEFNSSDILVES